MNDHTPLPPASPQALKFWDKALMGMLILILLGGFFIVLPFLRARTEESLQRQTQIYAKQLEQGKYLSLYADLTERLQEKFDAVSWEQSLKQQLPDAPLSQPQVVALRQGKGTSAAQLQFQAGSQPALLGLYLVYQAQLNLQIKWRIGQLCRWDPLIQTQSATLYKHLKQNELQAALALTLDHRYPQRQKKDITEAHLNSLIPSLQASQTISWTFPKIRNEYSITQQGTVQFDSKKNKTITLTYFLEESCQAWLQQVQLTE